VVGPLFCQLPVAPRKGHTPKPTGNGGGDQSFGAPGGGAVVGAGVGVPEHPRGGLCRAGITPWGWVHRGHQARNFQFGKGQNSMSCPITRQPSTQS